MNKYIDADRLHAFLKKKLESYKSKMVDPLKFPIDHIDLMALLAREYQALILQLESLFEEQSESSKGKFVFPNFLYARTIDNKTIDVSYAPQSMDAVEYVKNDLTEQPEVDLEKEIERVVEDYNILSHDGSRAMKSSGVEKIARHFYELGLNARKEESK